MTVQKLMINGHMHLCVLTPHERNCAARGDHFQVPANRRVIWRQGIANSVQLKAAGISAPPVVFQEMETHSMTNTEGYDMGRPAIQLALVSVGVTGVVGLLTSWYMTQSNFASPVFLIGALQTALLTIVFTFFSDSDSSSALRNTVAGATLAVSFGIAAWLSRGAIMNQLATAAAGLSALYFLVWLVGLVRISKGPFSHTGRA